MSILVKIKKLLNLYPDMISLNFMQQFIMRKYILEQNILSSTALGINKEKYCDHNIIVSLTTYGKRYNEVHLTIESIMEQTMKANRIILWLDYGLQKQSLPKALEKLKERGLEIMYCEDIRSYKKLIPTLKLCPQDAIITIDDDLIYEIDLLENLIMSYLSNPSYIYCHRFHKMRMNKNGVLLPYSQWEHCCNKLEPNILNFPTTGGGTLFPPNSLDAEVFNREVFMSICEHADDVWFKAMALKKGTLVKGCYSHSKTGEDYILNPNVQDVALTNINVYGPSLNNKQIHAVFEMYNLYEILS